MTSYEILNEGGKWLGATRNYIQCHFHNGEHVIFPSDTELRPGARERQFEEAAAAAVAADRREQYDRQMTHIKQLIRVCKGLLNKTENTEFDAMRNVSRIENIYFGESDIFKNETK